METYNQVSPANDLSFTSIYCFQSKDNKNGINWRIIY